MKSEWVHINVFFIFRVDMRGDKSPEPDMEYNHYSSYHQSVTPYQAAYSYSGSANHLKVSQKFIQRGMRSSDCAVEPFSPFAQREAGPPRGAPMRKPLARGVEAEKGFQPLQDSA